MVISGIESDLVVYELYGKNVEISAENEKYTDDLHALHFKAKASICVSCVIL